MSHGQFVGCLTKLRQRGLAVLKSQQVGRLDAMMRADLGDEVRRVVTR